MLVVPRLAAIAVELSGSPGLVVASEGSGASVCLVLGVAGVTAVGGVLRWGVLADTTVGGGVCPVCVACRYLKPGYTVISPSAVWLIKVSIEEQYLSTCCRVVFVR